MQITYHILLCAIALTAVIKAVSSKAWIASLIGIGLFLSALCMALSPVNLFYHSIALNVASSLSLAGILFLNQERLSVAFKWVGVAATLPIIGLSLLKVMQLQGTGLIKWFLLIGPLGLIYCTFERKVFDFYWFLLLYIALLSIHTLIMV